MHNFLANLQLVCNAVSLLLRHVLEQNLIPSVLILNHVRARVKRSTISHQVSQPFDVYVRNAFRESQLASHEDRHADLIRSDVWIRRDDTSASEVDSLAHHLHTEHAFFTLK